MWYSLYIIENNGGSDILCVLLHTIENNVTVAVFIYNHREQWHNDCVHL